MKLTKKQKLELIRDNYNKFGIYSVNDIERRHKGYWFSPDTMRFFKSKVYQDVFVSNSGKVFFVSSEKSGFGDDTRKFTVRVYDIKADSIENGGEFLAYESKAKAMTEALNLATKDA